MNKGTVYINLSSQIVKGKLLEIVGEKFIVELGDKSKCVVTKDQIVNIN